MSTITNDLGRPLSAPCPIGLLGEKCSEADYKSWRKIGVGMRKTLIEGADWSKPGTQELHGEVLLWLKQWIDTAEIDSPIEMGLSIKKAIEDPDPVIENGERFPGDLAWWQGTWNGEITYTGKTREIVQYIKNGKTLYDDAVHEGVITKKSKEIERAEERDPGAGQWIKLAIGGVAVAAVLGFGVWAYTEIVRALHSRDDA